MQTTRIQLNGFVLCEFKSSFFFCDESCRERLLRNSANPNCEKVVCVFYLLVGGSDERANRSNVMQRRRHVNELETNRRADEVPLRRSCCRHTPRRQALLNDVMQQQLHEYCRIRCSRSHSDLLQPTVRFCSCLIVEYTKKR